MEEKMNSIFCTICGEEKKLSQEEVDRLIKDARGKIIKANFCHCCIKKLWDENFKLADYLPKWNN